MDEGKTLGGKFARFCEGYMVHTIGGYAGSPFLLEPWQQDFINEALELNDDGTPVYKEIVLGIPRGNGKSAIASPLCLFALMALRGATPNVYCAAASRDQARLVFDGARDMAMANPKVAQALDFLQHEIRYKQNNGSFRKISSEANQAWGFRPSFIVMDELHTFTDPALFEALQTAIFKRPECQMLTISTAGIYINSILGQIYNRAMVSPFLERPNPCLSIVRDRKAGFLFYWYGVPADADIEDRNLWRLANPASFVRMDDLERDFASPTINEAAFRRYRLNQWAAASGSWLPFGAWESMADRSLTFRDGESIYVGVDVAAVSDSSAVVIVGEPRDGKRPVKAWIYEPSDVPMIFQVKEKLRELKTRYQIREVAYDRFMFYDSAMELAREGFPMVEFSQTNERLSPATQTTYNHIVNRKLIHDGDALFSHHLRNAIVYETSRGIRIDKSKSKDKIDAAVALIMALSRAEENVTRAPFFYFAEDI